MVDGATVGPGTAVLTVDADGHVMEPPSMWDEYLDPEYKGRGIRIAQTRKHGHEYLVFDDKPAPYPPAGLLGVLGGLGMDFRDLYTPGKVTFEESFPPAGWDPHERLAVMDSERIDVSVLYPTMGLFWEGWMGDDRDLLAAYCRAYNDWVWDFCATDARRLIPAGHVSLRNLDAAVAEVHRLANRGFRTIFIAPDVIDGHRFSEPMFDPFWRACEEAELPVGLHVVARPVRDHAVPDVFDGVNLPFHVSMSFPSDVMYGFAAAMFEGLFERFPRLKMLLLEAGGGWVPHFLDRMDVKWEKLAHVDTTLTMKPSEYFERQVWVSVDPDEKTLSTTVSQVGARKIVWASDYPHADGELGVVEEVLEAVEDLAPDDQRLISGGNVANLYGIER